MFTGIITDVGTIDQITRRASGITLRIITAYDADTIDIGASIACSGACLTVVEKGKIDPTRSWFDADVSTETLDKTTLGRWVEGTRINLERALRLGDELGGHMVSGHIDGLAKLVGLRPESDMARFDFEISDEFAALVATKGSVALDGTSLTVNSVEANRFSVMLIPHTLTVTTWGTRKVGDEFNFEADMMARHIARLREVRG